MNHELDEENNIVFAWAWYSTARYGTVRYDTPGTVYTVTVRRIYFIVRHGTVRFVAVQCSAAVRCIAYTVR